MNVLVLNAGSSSLKFQIIATDLDRIKEHQDDRFCRGEVERIGGEAIVRFQSGEDAKHKSPLRCATWRRRSITWFATSPPTNQA